MKQLWQTIQRINFALSLWLDGRLLALFCLKIACPAVAPAVPGGTLTRAAARCSHWLATNNNAPAYSIAERAGVALCPARACGCLCGPFFRAGI